MGNVFSAVQNHLEILKRLPKGRLSLIITGALLLLALITIPVLGSTNLFDIRQRAASGTIVTVSQNTLGQIQTQLSTNLVWSGMIDQAPGGQNTLNSLHAPLMRIHAGDDGDPVAMPEIKQNSWDFSAMNTLVNNVFTAGQQPLMNVKFAPDWQWTCTKFQGSGTVRDMTFGQFGDYMARLVSYYNRGSMTTETGQVITNPAGTSHKITWWELWNEPDLAGETPCVPPKSNANPEQNALTPAQYVTMWNAVTAKMLAVDASLKFVGPATAGSQFGSSNTTGNQYVDQLMAGSNTKPSALSFHGYGYWDNTKPDAWIFDGDHTEANCCGGIKDIKDGVTGIHNSYPNLPIWLTEVNVNADWGDDSHKRPSSELAAAWWGTLFATIAPLNAGIIHQYDVADSPQFGLFNDQSGKPYITYFVTQALNAAFPQGSTMLATTSTDPNIVSLAAKKTDGSISVLLVNRQVSSGLSTCGSGGTPASVTLALDGMSTSSVRLTQIDKNNVTCSNSVATAPQTTTLDASKPITVSFPGYGMALLSINTNGQTLPTSTPVPPTPTPNQAQPTPTPVQSDMTISGAVYIDANQDKQKSTGETNYLNGATITLSGNASGTTVTTSTGRYTFANLKPGTYTVSLSIPSGYKITTPSSKTLTLTTANRSTSFGIISTGNPPTPTQSQKPTPTPTITQTTGGGFVIFGDALDSGWFDNSWGDTVNNFSVSSPVFSGSKAMSFSAIRGWGGISLARKQPISVSAYKYLHFAAQASTSGQKYTVLLADANGNGIEEKPLESYGGDLTVGSWKVYNIPVKDLNPNNKTITQVIIQDAFNRPEPVVYLDEIQFSN